MVAANDAAVGPAASSIDGVARVSGNRQRASFRQIENVLRGERNSSACRGSEVDLFDTAQLTRRGSDIERRGIHHKPVIAAAAVDQSIGGIPGQDVISGAAMQRVDTGAAR